MRLASKSVKPRHLRRRLGLNQQQFWSAVGVTQSGGSRYEAGRSMPKPVSELLRLGHVENENAATEIHEAQASSNRACRRPRVDVCNFCRGSAMGSQLTHICCCQE